jgi:ankyrin repeat protein
MMKCLIDSNLDFLNIKNSENKTPLYIAIHFQRLDIIDYLLLKIAYPINLSNQHLYLHKAIRMRDPVIVKKLLDFGVDVNSLDDQGILITQGTLRSIFFLLILTNVLLSALS